MDVGLIGLGAMARAIAENLVAAGHRVRCWNRSGGDVAGVDMVLTPAEAFQADAVFTLLSDDAAIREVLIEGNVLAQAKPGMVHAVASTVSVAFSEELVQHHRQAGIDYVAAPVLGRPDVAAKGELNVLAAGAPAALQRLQPLFEVIGKRTWPLGDHPPGAHAAKIACNMMIAMAIEAMAEAAALTDANGVPRADFFELILGTLFGSRSYQVYSGLIVEGQYQPGFKASLGLKDLRLAREASQTLAAPLPALEAVHEQMRKAVAAGGADRDWSVMADYTLRAASAREGKP
ncbi:NAD(P)-dependent oxidoreductase [Chitinasiproducens palmae]|uniref:3-hydroxyisobutyrate dehydrogenase n=1 Tax=Chitinasiproducens palmae TaxID=1770053 RepID=A0A1H2PKE1_9BURK|nr:NAD(P)-dependent oxidoreductase [Chitinasiproducens palmae]SDV46770.1 3-hydroxyisobutyrate dehydrogenase [Chitinasiproducens palmae]